MKLNNLVGGIILVLFVTNTTIAQIVNIPDENFKAALISDATINTNGDSEIQISEAQVIDSLDISNLEIADITGIEAFTELTYLNCRDNYSLDSFNISNMVDLVYLDCSNDSLLTLDVKNNVALEYLDCSNNFYLSQTGIDVTSNTKLKALRFSSISFNGELSLNLSNNAELEFLEGCCNYMNEIDVRNNPMLKILYIGSCGSITSLDVTNNPLLEGLDCAMSQIEELDLSQNPNLNRLIFFDNRIKSIDLSNNPALTEIRLEMGYELEQVDLRNGNNTIIEKLYIDNNDSLFCIAVDNPWYSELNWLGLKFTKDDHTRYSGAMCDQKITGNIYYDEITDCIKGQEELNISGAIVQISSLAVSYATTDADGNFEFSVAAGVDYNISTFSLTNIDIDFVACQANGIDITIPEEGIFGSSIDIGLQFPPCAALSVDVLKNQMRRCIARETKLVYKNRGMVTSETSFVYIDYPEYVELISSSIPAIVVDAENKIYRFDVGNIPRLFAGEIIIKDSVVCGNEDIRGVTQCVKSWITPNYTCNEVKDTTDWDKSSIKVVDKVKCIDNITAQFTIVNAGDGNMLSPHEYRLYYNNELAYTSSFQLNSGDSLLVDATADGSTIRLEADQHILHPGKSRPRTTIEGCGINDFGKADLGYWPEALNDELDPEISEICRDIRDSYDPNDKTVSPSGVTDSHYIPEDETLEYKIRFQNTGNDEAYNILIVDTLSNSLDLKTLNILGASHSLEYNILGKGVNILEFRFKNINLPDSTTNEPGSHGYVFFSIAPINDIAPGTAIENFADIYFDYNGAIRTDTAAVIALDTVIVSEKVITVSEVSVGVDENKMVDVRVFPNPTNEYIIVEGDVDEYDDILIYDVIGKLMIIEKVSSKNQLVNVSHLKSGSYFIQLTGRNTTIRTFKMIKE